MPEVYQLIQKQVLPVESKVRLSLMRIRAWHLHWGDKIAVLAEVNPESRIVAELAKGIIPSISVHVVPEPDYYYIRSFMVETESDKIENWLLYGCNAFDQDPPECRPLSTWTRDDVHTYCRLVEPIPI